MLKTKLLKEKYRDCTICAYGELSDDENNVVINKERKNPLSGESYLEASYGKKFSCGAVVLRPVDNFTKDEIIKACKNRFRDNTIKSSNSSFLTMSLGESVLRYLIDREKKHVDCLVNSNNMEVGTCHNESCDCKKNTDDAPSANSQSFKDKYVKITLKGYEQPIIAYNPQREEKSCDVKGWKCDWAKQVSDNNVTTVSPAMFLDKEIFEIREATEAEVNSLKDEECKIFEKSKKFEDTSKSFFDCFTDDFTFFPFWGW